MASSFSRVEDSITVSESEFPLTGVLWAISPIAYALSFSLTIFHSPGVFSGIQPRMRLGRNVSLIRNYRHKVSLNHGSSKLLSSSWINGDTHSHWLNRYITHFSNCHRLLSGCSDSVFSCNSCYYGTTNLNFFSRIIALYFSPSHWRLLCLLHRLLSILHRFHCWLLCILHRLLSILYRIHRLLLCILHRWGRIARSPVHLLLTRRISRWSSTHSRWRWITRSIDFGKFYIISEAIFLNLSDVLSFIQDDLRVVNSILNSIEVLWFLNSFTTFLNF